MRKTTRRLTLRPETIRQLTETELGGARGGGITGSIIGCSNFTCGCTEGCPITPGCVTTKCTTRG